MTGQPPPGGPPDPRRRLNKTRNIIIGVIVVLTIFALIGACTARVARGGGIGGSARDYITQNYERDTSLDEGDVDAGIWTVGTVMGLIHDIPTCDELISRIVDEAEDIITARLGDMVNLDERVSAS